MSRAVAFGVVAVILAAGAGVATTIGYLPDKVATHFGAGGRANGWMSRVEYAWMMTALVLAMPLAVWLVLAILPRRWPRLVNLPHRDYWLAPERREATLDRLAILGATIALACVALLVFMHVEIIDANRRVPASLDAQVAAVPLVVASAIVALVVGIAISFRRPKDARR